MPLPALKLSMAASFCANPCKLVRHITFTTTKISSPKLSNSRWRIAPCAHLSLSAHVSVLPCNNLDHRLRFTCRKICLSSSPNRSSTNKAGLNPNPDPNLSSGSGIVADMGSENEKAANNDWYYNQQPSSSSSPSMQQQPASSKLLTLPTILTLGRVAAVPLLICSMFSFSSFFDVVSIN